MSPTGNVQRDLPHALLAPREADEVLQCAVRQTMSMCRAIVTFGVMASALFRYLNGPVLKYGVERALIATAGADGVAL